MNYSDVLNIECKNTEVFLGYYGNILKKVDLSENPSVIITGSTGTSKSVMMHQILLQLIKNNNSDDLKIITINPTKVELKPYRDSIYSFHKDIELDSSNLSILINIIDSRINLFKENEVEDYYSYNEKNNEKKLPIIVLAIDEATDLLKENNSDEKFRYIINNCKKVGLILLLDTNDIYNQFFFKGYNTMANIRISFDFVSNEDSKITNLHNCDKLALDEFIIEMNNNSPEQKLKSFIFEDSIIKEILNKKS